MNWLAHLYLSEAAAPFRIGNLLTDLLPPADLAALPASFQRGVTCHRRIDAFTDAHPVVRRSIKRIPPTFRRFGGIVVDILYDHFLSRDWAVHSPRLLPDFVAEIYVSFAPNRRFIPARAYARLEEIRSRNLLCAYGELASVADVLDRLGSHLRRPLALGAVVPELTPHYEALHADFVEFFPAVREHVANLADSHISVPSARDSSA